MSLITEQDLIRAAGLDKLPVGKRLLAGLSMKALKLDEVNSLYDSLKDYQGTEFLDQFLQKLGLQYIVFQEDLDKIPKNGAFIAVSNHPLGALDGIIFTKIFSEVRPDFKIMGNFLLTKIKPMKDVVIPVNPFQDRKEAFNSTSGMRAAIEHLKNGSCLGMFPAGEVSKRKKNTFKVEDKAWETPVLKLMMKMGVPIVPVYFHAKNSNLFYRLADIHPSLQTALLPREMLVKRTKPISIRIGKAISPKVIDEKETPEELEKYLRRKISLLQSYYDSRKSITDYLKLPNLNLIIPQLKTQNVIQNIISETPTEDIVAEINLLQLEDKNSLVLRNGAYEVYVANYEKIPNIIREIGRQRELSFRKVGEGTNLPFDLDSYDAHYNHLFLWDAKAQKIAGAYRLGIGSSIMKTHGKAGFYLNSLFDFDDELDGFFEEVMEMGRAYVHPEYQLKPFPLFLLWRGIVHICLRNPQLKFLIGGVSISNKFSEFSKNIMIDFMRSHYYDAALAQYVHPKNEFKITIKSRDRAYAREEAAADLNKLDKIINDLEPEMRMPILMKKYVKQNAKVIAFNVDPKFNDAIDGLMYIRIADLPESTIRPVLEELSEQMAAEKDIPKE